MDAVRGADLIQRHKAGLPWTQPGLYSYRQGLQIQVILCTSQHNAGEELDWQN